MGNLIIRILKVLFPSYFLTGKIWVYPVNRKENLWELAYVDMGERSNHRFTVIFEDNKKGAKIFKSLTWLDTKDVFTEEDYLRNKNNWKIKNYDMVRKIMDEYLA